MIFKISASAIKEISAYFFFYFCFSFLILCSKIDVCVWFHVRDGSDVLLCECGFVEIDAKQLLTHFMPEAVVRRRSSK